MEGGRVSLVGPGFGRVPVVVAQRRASLVTNRGVCVGWPHLLGYDPVGRVAANALARRWWWWRLLKRRRLRRGWWWGRRRRWWWWHELGALVDLSGYLQYPLLVLVAGIVHSRQHHPYQTFLPLRVGTEHACTGSKGSIDKFTRMVRFIRFVHHGLLRAYIIRQSLHIVGGWTFIFSAFAVSYYNYRRRNHNMMMFPTCTHIFVSCHESRQVEHC